MEDVPNHPLVGIGGAGSPPDPIDHNRFSGFASLYDRARPQPPRKMVEIALGILGKDRLGQVADLGSGTGLSTAIWKPVADRVVGIEPTLDMRTRARERHPDIEFIDGDGDLRTLPCHLPERGGMDGFYAARLRRVG